MPKLAVLLWITLLCSSGAMSAYGSGAKDQIDPALTDDVEALLERSVLREFAGLEPTPILAPVPPAAGVGGAFVEIPLIIEDGHVPGGYVPLDDLDALYGVYGYGPPVVVPAPAHAEPPMVDDTPAMIASVWSNPPLDAK